MKKSASQRASHGVRSNAVERARRRHRSRVAVGACLALCASMIALALPHLSGARALRSLAHVDGKPATPEMFAASAGGSWAHPELPMSAGVPPADEPLRAWGVAPLEASPMRAPRPEPTPRAMPSASWGVSGGWDELVAAMGESMPMVGVRGASSAPARPMPAPVPPLSPEQQRIAAFLADKYRVALAEVQRFVHYAYKVGREMRVDPTLILAVMSVESSFNPNARSHRGAQGLMQVHTRVHTEKFRPFGGEHAAFEPLTNIRVGARILREYLNRDGSTEAALKSYVGAALLPHDSGYGHKVLSERERIAAASKGRPIPRLPLGPAPDLQALEAKAAQQQALGEGASGGGVAAAAVGAAAAAGAIDAALEVPDAPAILPGEHGQPVTHEADSAALSGPIPIPGAQL